MYVPMDELGISNEHRVEARRIRCLQKNDRRAQNISTVGFLSREGTYEPSNPPKKRDNLSNHGDKQSDYYVLKNIPAEPYPPGSITLLDGDELLSTGLCYYDEADATPYWPSWGVTLTPMDIERWKCAANLFKENPPSGIWDEFEGLLSSNGEVSDWPPLFDRNIYNARSIWVLFLTAGFLYGGMHALPWNTLFRSTAERTLWRLSTSIIIGFGPLTLLLYSTIILYDHLKDRQSGITLRIRNTWSRMHPLETLSWRIRQYGPSKLILRLSPVVNVVRRVAGIVKDISDDTPSLSVMAAAIAGALFVAIYGIARIYLIVECFLSLSYAEPAVFKVPSWSTYLPHIN